MDLTSWRVKKHKRAKRRVPLDSLEPIKDGGRGPEGRVTDVIFGGVIVVLFLRS